MYCIYPYDITISMDTRFRVLNNFFNLTSFPIFVGYLLILPLSRIWVRKVPKLNLKWTLVFYNLLCVAISIVCTVVGFKEFLSQGNFLELVEASGRLKQIFFLYWVSKILELMDTVFMVLKHSLHQMSFLHIFHHSTMILLADYTYSLSPWRPMSVVIFMNSFVHIWMYSYYAISVVKKVDSSWKKTITHIQLIQFVIGVCISIPGYFYYGHCIYSFLYPVSMILLFGNFYYHAFVKRRATHRIKPD